MATITTTTQTGSMASPVGSVMDRNPADNSLWVALWTATTTVALFQSTNGGVSWTSQGTFTQSGIFKLCELRIDSGGQHIHLAFLSNNGTSDIAHYKRCSLTVAGVDLSSGVRTISTQPTGTPGGVYVFQSLLPILHPDNTINVIHAISFQGAKSGVQISVTHIANDAVFSTSGADGLVFPGRIYQTTGTFTQYAALDFEHNGDSITSTSPSFWISAGLLASLIVVKGAYQGYKTGWKTPGTATSISTNRSTPGVGSSPGRWDGTRFVMVTKNISTTSKLDVFERNQSNTTTTTRTTPTSHPQGVITSYGLSYNHVTRDLRLYAAGTTNLTVYYIDYIRATGTWGSWTQVSATAPTSGGMWSVRRSTAGLYEFDFAMQSGTATPWTDSNVIQAINFAPNAPSWVYGTGTTPLGNGQAFDVSSSLNLDWAFNDPNTTDTQGSYAVSRQIGAAAIQYWRASDSTWQVAEVQNTSATTALLLTTAQWLGAGGATDPAHVYKVKAWDSAGLPSVYSEGLAIIPSTRVDPTLTAPTAAQVLNVGQVTATWTVSEQSAYRVTLTDVTSGALVHDSGFLASATALAYTVPVDMPDGFSGSLTLQTKNAEGLSSVIRTDAFTVDFVDAPVPVIAVTPTASQGGIFLNYTQVAPSGTQPTPASVDLWRRRVVTLTPTNTNPTFEVDASDWTNSNFSTAARSTAQAHTGTASLLCTPNGASALPLVQSGTYTIVGGTRWEIRTWFRATTTANAVRIYLRWYNGGTPISDSTRDVTPIATTWLYGYYAATSPTTANGVKIAVGYVGTPLAGNLLNIDDSQLFAANDDDGIRVVAGAVASTSYLDWRTVSDIAYEYQGVTAAQNATSSAGPWYG